jgi:hypothetical protein
MKKLTILTIFTLFALLTLLSPRHTFAQEAEISILSGSKTFAKDETFAVDVKLNLLQAATAAKIYINYDSAKLTGQSIDTSVSDFTTAWPEATFDSSSGLIKLQAAQTSPGISGDATVARLTFKAIAGGDAILTLDSSSLVLTEDDQNLISGFPALATFTITTPPPPPNDSGGGGDSGGDNDDGGGGGGDNGGGGDSQGSSPSGGSCSKAGDVDCNGTVDITDLSKLLSNWGKNSPSADFNKNGIVDIVDLSRLLANWKK